MSADDFKAKGNAAFSAGEFEEAIAHFSAAIAIDPSNHVLYSNRSACKASLKQYQGALEDASKVVEIKPDWAKGYSRVGAAFVGLQKYDDAIEAYKKGLAIEPHNDALKNGLRQAEDAASGDDGGAGIGGMFSSPDFLAKLAMNPETRDLVSKPDFMMKLNMIQRNPSSLGQFLQDPDIMKALSVGLGISVMNPSDMSKENGFADEAPSAPKPPPKPAPKAEPEPEMNDEEKAAKRRKEEAMEEKTKGNEYYKKKEFAEAIKCYEAALNLDDTDISFLTNKAAVYYEMGDYDKCIEDCTKAIERGRQLYADYKMIARAMTRKEIWCKCGVMGVDFWSLSRYGAASLKANAMCQKGELEAAIDLYKDALLEHRNPDTLQRLNEAEKRLKKEREDAYIDMDLSSQEREQGNTYFKEHKYPEAIKCYTEAIGRGPPHVNPECYKIFSNRAACYIKLGALPEAEKDADKCIELCPTFGKGYSRKAHVQYLMKEYNKSLNTYQLGLKHDPESTELKQGVQNCIQQMNRMNRGELSEEETKERQQRAMADPEIQTILTDPVMRQVLQDMQDNPKAAQQHLRNADIMSKIQKLAGAGIIQLR